MLLRHLRLHHPTTRSILIVRMGIAVCILLVSLTAYAADFPTPYDSATDHSKPMPAAEAAAKMGLPPGFKATVFAAEPDVCNPIAMAWDARGRLWIAENYTYAEAGVRYDLKLRDRILIFEDRNGDGHFSSRRVFTDQVQMLTSIEVGEGGVWALCLPNLLFFPDRNHTGTPDGPPEVVLDGFKAPVENYHNMANGLRFGPDGWLYGRCGATGVAEIGAPGTPPAQRVPVRGGMWRYHPRRKVFETITCGNTNPWGHDWNEFGELFYVNTVNGHLWHGIPGAHFPRSSTVDPNPHVYALLEQHADHYHYDNTGKDFSVARNALANAYGGGHSHIGAMIYLGDNWPAECRGHLFTLNQHGKRANQEILERAGSGYVGHHGQDTLLAADPWFIGIDLSYGPDGGVYVLDWNDTGECHGRYGIHRSTGRIFKITAGNPKPVTIGDIAKLDSGELAKLHTHPNEWFARQARLELAARANAGQDLTAARSQLRALFDTDPNTVDKLRAMWSLYVIGGVDDAFLRAALRHPDEHVRTWAVRLLSDAWPLDTLMSVRPQWRSDYAAAILAAPAWQDELLRLAHEDPSGLVRLAIASTLQRLPIMQRPAIAAALAAHKEDATGAPVSYKGDPADHNLPLMIWYGLIPVGDSDPAALVKVAAACELPQTRRCIAQRLAEDIEKNPGPLNGLLATAMANPSPDFSRDVLAGITKALAGWRKAPKPSAWDGFSQKSSTSTDEQVRNLARDLSVVFGDGRAIDEVKQVALDNTADLLQRKTALQTLIDNKSPDLRPVCEKLLSIRFLNPIAARGLATFDDPEIGVKLVGAWKQFHPTERGQLLAALVSRPSFAVPLLEAVGAGKIPRSDLTPFHARQILSFHDPALDKKLAEVWGELREISGDKKQFMAKLKHDLTPQVIAGADTSNGRAVFAKTCAACHRLYGEGGDVGPDLTGSGRANLDYLLENIIDPSAVVPADFRMTVLKLKDGRVLNGIVSGRTEKTLLLKTMTEKLTIELSEIVRMQESAQSLMPEGLVEGLSPAQARDLFAYLMRPSQAPLPSP